MIILGIDPGYAITGYGVIESVGSRIKMLKYGAVNTTPKMLYTNRLLEIKRQISEITHEYHPDACAVEQLFFNTNTTTAIHVAQGRGVAVTAVAEQGIPIYEYTPLQVKQTVVGYGRAEKQQIQQMVKILLKLEEIPKPDDAADALAIAICHSFFGVTAKPV